jgi:DNA replication protein DnaC
MKGWMIERAAEPIKSMLIAMEPPPDVACPKCRKYESAGFIEHFGMCERCIKKERHRQARRENLAAIWQSSGLPPAAREMSFSKTDPVRTSAKAIQACRNWEYGHSGLYLWGPTGVGKTRLALCLARRELFEHERRVLFVDLPRLFQDLKESFKTAASGPRRVLSAARKAEVLVLDDIGVGHGRDFGESELLPIVSSRLDEGLPTIYTSNLSWSKKNAVLDFPTLEDRLGPRVAQRIIFSAKSVWFTCQSNLLSRPPKK